LESLPVILLTAKGKVDDRIAGYEAGADAYLTKPIDPEELLSVLEGVLRRDIVSSMRNDDHAAATEKDEVSLSKRKDSIEAMEEIKREILEIKSLLRQRNNNTFESAATSQDEIIDATSSSFGSMYKDLLEMKESIKVSLLDDKPVDESVQVYPKVTLSEINEQYFTPDETKVISLVEQGLTNREIGEEHLDCSISKVEKIISSLFKKTGTKKRPELVDWCKQNRVNERQQTVIQDVDDDISEFQLSSQLSEKEKEIMRLLGLGLTNKEIVAKTGVLLKDIVSVVDAMLAKAKVKNRTELMRWWNDEGNNNILL
jgi:DNA-binding NarL/FixJ family response regulator